jgi:hypothetical protein
VLRLPGIHLVLGLAKRWLQRWGPLPHRSHHGAVHKKHLQAYRDAYVFRLYGAFGVKREKSMPCSFLCQILGGASAAAVWRTTI